MTKITYGDFEIDFSTLPEASTSAILSRGLTHFLGNEQASKVHSWAMGETQANSDDRDVVKAWKLANADAVKAKTVELVDAAIKTLSEGTIGTRTSAGPKVEPIDKAKRAIAKTEVLKVLADNKIKAPKKDEKVRFANGTEKSLDEMIASRLAHETHGPRIAAEAEKALKAQAKKLAEVAAMAKVDDGVEVSSDALGL